MTPVIRIDDDVMDYLKKKAAELGMVFEPPNAVLRAVLLPREEEKQSQTVRKGRESRKSTARRPARRPGGRPATR